jgi:dTDP-4-dehydrorhamnose reductase
MKLLVTGVSGLLGINFAQEMMGRHEIIGVDRGKLAHAPFHIIKQDLLDSNAADYLLDAAHPQAVIHCAALADLEACEADPSLAQRLNTDVPQQLARACKVRDIPFIHISTDAVFDGEKMKPTPKMMRQIRWGCMRRPNLTANARC